MVSVIGLFQSGYRRLLHRAAGRVGCSGARGAGNDVAAASSVSSPSFVDNGAGAGGWSRVARSVGGPPYTCCQSATAAKRAESTASSTVAGPSLLRTTAIALETLVDVQPDHPYVGKMARYLLETRGPDGRYRTTQESAFALMARHAPEAVAAFQRLARLRPEDLAVRWQLDRLTLGCADDLVELSEK